MKFLAMACAAALAGCMGKAEPRVGAVQPAATPQVTEQCLRQRDFPGCMATCQLHPWLSWCSAPAVAPAAHPAGGLTCDQANILTTSPPQLRCWDERGHGFLCRTDGSSCH